MPLFQYKAVRPSGEVLNGEMEAADQAGLARQLQRDGLIPIQVIPVRGGGGLRLLPRRQSARVGIGADAVLHFTRELATLLEAGMTLDRSLQMLAELTEDPRMEAMIKAIRERIQSGSMFSSALESQGATFSPLYVSTIKAGEAGGVLHQVLQRLADYLERAQGLRESIRAALVYPSILLVVATLSVTALLVFVVPQFSQMFEDMGQALPLPTRIVVGVGDFMRNYWWALLAAIFLVVALVQQQFQRPAVRKSWDRWVLRMPLLGDLVAKVETARFARTLGTLVGNGLSLLPALGLARGVVANSRIAASLDVAAESLKRGKGLADPLLEQRVLPPLALQMLKVGEESGDLEPMLLKVADVFDREVGASVKRMLTLLEPILIVVLGLFVVGIIVSILLPMLEANQLVV